MNQTAPKVEVVSDRIPCLVATLIDRKLLLPITAVAEVINTVTMPESGNDKTPLYGWINWREQRIPLLSLEHAMGGGRPQLKFENRMAVINAIGDASGVGFYAILLQNLPTPIQVNTESIRGGEGETAALVVANVTLGEEQMIVPDLLAVEKVVKGFKKGN